MRSLKDTDQIIGQTYFEADFIYSLSRNKEKFNIGEKIAEVFIFLFTPFVNGVRQMDALSDLGIYYLVEQGSKQLLVRVAKSKKEKTIEEKDISGTFVNETCVIDQELYRKIRTIKSRV